ncbi:MAG: L,D-transpeptidase family protein [Pseudomonadota bacterium]
MNRLLRPLIWAVTAVAIGAAIGFFTSAKADPPPLRPVSERADMVLIEKADRRLTLLRGGEAIGTYDIALGFAPEGDKAREGDGRTPEGRYKIDRRNDRSSFTLSLGIDYPRPDQRARAKAEGRDPGGDIFIHGQPNGYPGSKIRGDWTHGCAAVTNAEMREIWSRVAIGTAVEIRP